MSELLTRYRNIPTATICDAYLRTGTLPLTRVVLSGVRVQRPFSGASIAGLARTQQLEPVRDSGRSSLVSDRPRHFRLVDSASPDDFLVVATGGATHVACFGDMLALKARERGAVGVALDGAVRDVDLIHTIGLGLWCTGVTPVPMGSAGYSVASVDEQVVCAGVEVNPGDVVVGDGDGVVVVGREEAAAILDVAEELETTEERARAGVARGEPLAELYPSRAYYRRDDAEPEPATAGGER